MFRERGQGPEQICLCLACHLWVLRFEQEGFHSRSPGDLESTCMNAGGRETKGEEEKKGQERDRAACLGL